VRRFEVEVAREREAHGTIWLTLTDNDTEERPPRGKRDKITMNLDRIDPNSS